MTSLNQNQLDYLTRDLINQFIDLRKQRCMTQEECNHLLGVADRLVSKWECGTRIPKVFHLCCWAEVLDAKLILTPYEDNDPWPVDMEMKLMANDNFLKDVA